MNTKKIVRIAIFIALACVFTFFPKVPLAPFGSGYVHFGDCIIYIAAVMLGPTSGAIVGAVGHSLADLISGYPLFCIPTFIIKALMGYTVGKAVYNQTSVKRYVIAALSALVIVTGGYFIAEIPLYGIGPALVSLISSPIQWVMSMVASALVLPILLKNRKRIGF